MNVESVLRRADGSRVLIQVNFQMRGNRAMYYVSVSLCQKGKRTWRNCHDSGQFLYGSMNMEERLTDVRACQLKFVSADEIHAVKNKLWQLLKPEIEW